VINRSIIGVFENTCFISLVHQDKFIGLV